MLKRSMLYAALCMAAMLHPGLSMAADDSFDKTKLCDAAGDLARVVMTSRLKGMPMQDMVNKIANGAPNEKMVSKMIIEAYESPMYQTEDHKARAIGEFRDRWYLDCYKAVSRK